MVKLPGLEPILPSDILYLAGDGPYTEVITINNRLRVSSINLSRVEILIPSFIRIHKEYLINPVYVYWVERPTKQFAGQLMLKNGRTLPISRRRWKAVRQHLSERPQST